jgi:hypothetical protein
MQIVATKEEVKDPSRQTVKAQAGDAEPARGEWSQHLVNRKVTWLAGHYGIVYGRHPLNYSRAFTCTGDRAAEVVYLPSPLHPTPALSTPTCPPTMSANCPHQLVYMFYERNLVTYHH